METVLLMQIKFKLCGVYTHHVVNSTKKTEEILFQCLKMIIQFSEVTQNTDNGVKFSHT